MTIFDRSKIPTSIITTEALAIWVAEIHQNCYPELTCVEFLDDAGQPVPRRVMEANKFFFTANKPAEWRHVARHSIRIRPNHQVSGRLWDAAVSFGDIEIPNGFLQQ